MQFGNLSGLVNGTEQVVYDSGEILAPVATISTGNILNGDEDGWYTVIIRDISSVANTNQVTLYFNADSGNNYGRRLISAANTSVTNVLGTAEPGFYGGGNLAGGHQGLHIYKIYAKSGAVRLGNYISAYDITGTTVTNIRTGGFVWNNTVDNIISMTVYNYGNYDFAVGTRVIVLKSNNFTNGTPTGVITTPYIKGSWVRVGSQTLGAATNSVTFSNLNGNRDVIYSWLFDIKSSGGTTDDIRVRFNADAGSNYGNQILAGANTTVSASRSVTTYMRGGYTAAAGRSTHNSGLLFAKSNFGRSAIISQFIDINGTTILNLSMNGQIWTNTTDNITSVSITPTSNNFDAGSQFSLYALRPNG